MPFDLVTTAGLISALSGAVIAIATMFFVQRRTNKKNNSDIISTNYQTLLDEVRADISRLRTEQADERRQWAEERKMLNAKIDKLQDLIRSQDKALHAKEVEVAELRGQVNLLQAQLNQYTEAHTAKNNKTVTVNT